VRTNTFKSTCASSVARPTALVTVRYHPVETFDLFSQKLCKAPVGAVSGRGGARLINTGSTDPRARAQQ
jgi:hypothetical protein